MRDYGLEKLVLETLRSNNINASFVRQSGALHHSEDVFTSSCMIQCKETTKSSYGIQYNDICRLWYNTKQLGKKHAIFVVRISVGSLPTILVYECILQNKVVKEHVDDTTNKYYQPYIVTYIGNMNEFVSNYSRFK